MKIATSTNSVRATLTAVPSPTWLVVIPGVEVAVACAVTNGGGKNAQIMPAVNIDSVSPNQAMPFAAARR